MDNTTAANWQLQGVSRYTQFDKVHAVVRIEAQTKDPQRAVFTAIKIADRLAKAAHLDCVRVFVRTDGSDGKKVARVQRAPNPHDFPAAQGEVWGLMKFWGDDNITLKLLDPDDIVQPVGFADAFSEYVRVCPPFPLERCKFGSQGW